MNFFTNSPSEKPASSQNHVVATKKKDFSSFFLPKKSGKNSTKTNSDNDHGNETLVIDIDEESVHNGGVPICIIEHYKNTQFKRNHEMLPI